MKAILIVIFRYFFYGIILAIAAWASVHILAIFGVFMAIGFVIWWLMFPKKRVCLMCLFGHKSKSCKYCRQQKPWKSVIASFFLVIIFSLVSVGVVYLESKVLLNFGILGSPKTVSFVIPPKSQHRIGEIFPMQILLTGIQTPVNAIQADIGFDPTQLMVVDVSTKDSFAKIFIQKEVNNDGGWVRLTGGLPNPGYFSDNGLFGTVYFQAKTAGMSEINFLSSSMVLANDGRGTNVLVGFPSVSYLIIPDRLTPRELEQQKNLSSIVPSPVLGARTGISGGMGTQLSFVESAPRIPVIKDESVKQANPVVSKGGQTGTVSLILNFIQRVDSYLLQLLRLI